MAPPTAGQRAQPGAASRVIPPHPWDRAARPRAGIPERRPYRCPDILARLERRGAISPTMRQAGEAFRAALAAAHRDPPAVRPLALPRGLSRWSGASPSAAAAAREARGAVLAVGGPHSAAGSCLMHVLGLEMSLKQWARTIGWGGRAVGEETASGILVGALSVLAGRFERELAA